MFLFIVFFKLQLTYMYLYMIVLINEIHLTYCYLFFNFHVWISCQRKSSIKKQNKGHPFQFLVSLSKLFIYFFNFSTFELFCVF